MNRTFHISGRGKGAVSQFFEDRLQLRPSDDLRAVLHVPVEYQDTPASMDLVAVGVAYQNFIGRTCCMHTVIQRPEFVTPRMVRETFHYPFITCGLTAVLALVDSANTAAVDFDTRLGFKEIYRIPDGGLEGDMIILEMQRNNCRWIRPH
jgi:hypothetical protein